MRYHIWTVGCQMNKADSAKLAAGLERLGYEAVERPQDAEIVVLNTCSVRGHAEERAISKLGILKKLRATRDDLKIAVMGCMVGARTDELRKRFPYVDVFARPQDYDPILAAIGIEREDLGGACLPVGKEFWPRIFATPDGPTAFVPVIHGCDKFCSFCIVPYRRGRERSRPIDDIRAEVAHHVACGVKEVTLLGQTVEAFGHDLPAGQAGLTDRPDLGDLMRALHDIEGLQRIRFLTSYPKDMTARIIDAVAELPKVCEQFSLPVQSGDDAVLARMRRGYTIAEYREKLAMVRARMPHAAVSTDVIVGFCGETEAQFRRTYDLLEELRFDKVYVAAYSPRPGTIAWRKLEDSVPQAVKMERLRAVEELEARIAGEINAALAGSTVEVLVESATRRDRGNGDSPLRRLSGRTRSGKLVHFDGPCAVGDLVSVRIEKTSPWSLQGALLSRPKDSVLSLSKDAIPS